MVTRPWRYVGLSFLVGLIALGEEILWVRLLSFMLQSIPQAFTLVLFCFIIGIAFGALLSSQLVRNPHDPDRLVALLLALSGITVCAVPWALPWLQLRDAALPIGALILLTAMFKGAVFPLLHHYFSQHGRALGRTLSLVYGANVLGSTLGPLLVGFILMDRYPAYSLMFALGAAELLLALAFVGGPRPLRALAAVALLALAWQAWQDSREQLARSIAASHDEGQLTHLIENRHGVIYTISDAQHGTDRVYGGNVYDGAVNVDPANPVNMIQRVYLLAGQQPAPKRVAVIGLSVGSWLRVIEAFPAVERIDVIEINPGYLELSRRYPGYDGYLHDPRVRLHITDGRKWLAQQALAGERYDLIVMNTTWHWRIYTSLLLSQDFMRILRQSLSADGVLAFNATGSADAFYTAAQTFPFAYKYLNFVYAGLRDFRPQLRDGGARFCRIDFARLGLPGCGDARLDAAAANMFATPLQDWKEFSDSTAPTQPPELITDDNMLTEYRRGRHLF